MQNRWMKNREVFQANARRDLVVTDAIGHSRQNAKRDYLQRFHHLGITAEYLST